MSATVAVRLAQRDADRFVGRRLELAVFEALMVDAGPGGVVHVHGPGGIGKSALLREVARLAAIRGWSPIPLDGRELAPVPGEIEGIFAAAREETRPVILLDTYERLLALDALLRRRLVPELPEGSIVVLAGREPPRPGWFTDGWEHLCQTVRLGPLGEAEGRDLVRAAGSFDEPTTSSLVAWSAGSPLALALATAIAEREGRWDDRALGDRPELIESLVRRLAPEQVEDEHAEVTAVAAVARVTNAAMLADVLPGADPHAGYRWLRGQAIAEPVGDGLAMHDLVRKAVRAHLRSARPDRERELRRRIADHLFARATAGEHGLTVDLAELIENPALRWGFGGADAAELHAGMLRPGELDGLAGEVLDRGSDAWWAMTRALAAASPQHFIVARDADEVLCGVAAGFTPQNASPAALEDPFVGEWIRHARATVPTGDALVWRDSLDLTTSERGDLGSRVLAVVNAATVLRSGLTNPRVFYLPISPANAASVAFARDAGARHVPELDVRFGELCHECHVIDFGPDGLLGAQLDAIYGELGIHRARPAAQPSRRAAAITAADVHQALRDLDRPSRLAESPLATAVGGAHPAVAVRALLTRSAAAAFGTNPGETLMRDLVHRAYVEHRVSHEDAAHELFVSRSTYFRRLRRATDRVTDHVLASLAVDTRG